MSSVGHARRHLAIHGLWFGPLLTFAGMVSYFEYFVRFPVLRDFPWVNLPLVLAGLASALVGLWVAFRRPARLWVRLAGVLAVAFAGLVGGFFLTYVFALSYDLPEVGPSDRLMIRSPEFALSDHTGSLHRLSDYRGRKVVLVFYRGHW